MTFLHSPAFLCAPGAGFRPVFDTKFIKSPYARKIDCEPWCFVCNPSVVSARRFSGLLSVPPQQQVSVFFIIYLAVAKRGSEYRWVDAEEMGL
jgi:hypothetical protein